MKYKNESAAKKILKNNTNSSAPLYKRRGLVYNYRTGFEKNRSKGRFCGKFYARKQADVDNYRILIHSIIIEIMFTQVKHFFKNAQNFFKYSFPRLKTPVREP